MTSPQELEENKRIVREFIETAFNQHEADKAGALLTPDMKWHGGTLGTVEGRENVAGLVRTIVDALPDLHNVEQDIIAERDIVAVRAVVEATHEGDQTTSWPSSTGSARTLRPGSRSSLAARAD